MWTPRLRPLCVACPPVAPVFMAYGAVANFAVASSTAHIATTCSAVGTSHNLTEATNVMAPGILNPLIGHGLAPCSLQPARTAVRSLYTPQFHIQRADSLFYRQGTDRA